MSEEKPRIKPTFKARLAKFVKSPYMLVVPAFLFYALFWAYPVLNAVKEVFTSIPEEGGGLSFASIRLLLEEEYFWESIMNSLVFAVFSILLQFFLALGLALLINRKFKGSSTFLFLMMLPMAIPIAAVGIIWSTGLTEFGWINSIIEVSGLQGILNALSITDGPILWQNAYGFKAIGFLILVDTWTVLPSVMIIILAGLQNLNKEYQEAALVFGATRSQTIKDIVVPIIKPTIITALLLRIISGVQVWLISVIIFGHNKVPFLVERIVYYTKVFYNDAAAEKIAYGYSVVVVIVVMSIAYLFLRANRDTEGSSS